MGIKKISLFAVYLTTQGVNPREHPVKSELVKSFAWNTLSCMYKYHYIIFIITNKEASTVLHSVLKQAGRKKCITFLFRLGQMI